MKNFFYSLPAVASAKAGSFVSVASAKAGSFVSVPSAKAGSFVSVALFKAGLFLFIFIFLQACSQSPSDASNKDTASVLKDSAAVLGSSPDNAYRLFKGTRQLDGKEITDLILLRLNDLHETLVASIPAKDSLPKEPKFFWSKDSKYLLVDHSVPDSAYQYEVVLFDLKNLAVAQRNPGELVNYDKANDVVFYYRNTLVRQSICYYYVDNPSKESVRDVIAIPVGKLPSIILVAKDKQARVKAYTIDNTPVNFAINYN